MYNLGIMAVTKKPEKQAAKDAAPKATRTRKERKFPALTFEEALVLPSALQQHAAGQRFRLTLFEKLDQSPDSNETHRLITASGHMVSPRAAIMPSISNLHRRATKPPVTKCL